MPHLTTRCRQARATKSLTSAQQFYLPLQTTTCYSSAQHGQARTCNDNKHCLIARCTSNALPDKCNSSTIKLTCEGHHGQACVLDLCGLEAEHLVSVVTASQVQGVKEAT